MLMHRKLVHFLAFLTAVCAGVMLLWPGMVNELWIRYFSPKPSPESSVDVTPNEQALYGKAGLGALENSTSDPKRITIPSKALQQGHERDEAEELPPSPSLPQVALEANQEERRAAFQLKESVDHIVLKNEPFEVGGKMRTIEEIEKRLRGERELKQLIPFIQERDVEGSLASASSFPSQVAEGSTFYGVRVVRPMENIWDIHYRIIREYLLRRGITLAADADEPYPDGRSSGIGRLLKFMEGVVFVYNLDANRLEGNLNLISPDTVLVFFKISSLFSALDQLQADDLPRLRYTRGYLEIGDPTAPQPLIHRRILVE